jgi:hypothetical protein
MLAGVADQHLPLTQIATQHHDLILRPERGGQQAIAVQPLNPLTVQDIGFGPTADLPGLPRIDQEHLEAATLEQLKERDPVDAGRFHGHGRDAAGSEPVGEGFEVGGTGTEPPDVGRQVGRMISGRRGRGLGRHGHPMLGGMDVNAGRMGVLHP